MDTVLQGAIHQHAVVVVGILLLGLGVTEVACHGVDALDVAAGDPADSINIVAVHLGQDAVGHLDVIHPGTGLAGAAGVGVDLHQFADLTGFHQPLCLPEAGIETAHKADLQLHTCLVAGFNHLIALFYGHSHGLLAENMLACSGAVNDDLLVQISGSNNHNCVHLRIVQNFVVIGIVLVDAHFLGSSLGSGFHCINAGHHPSVFYLVLVVSCVDHTGTAATNKADAQFLLFHNIFLQYIFKIDYSLLSLAYRFFICTVASSYRST